MGMSVVVVDHGDLATTVGHNGLVLLLALRYYRHVFSDHVRHLERLFYEF